MWRVQREKLTEDSFSDPLARRIFVRTQAEIRRDEQRTEFYQAAANGGRANGNAAAGIGAAFVFEVVWAILTSIGEQVADEWRRFRKKRMRARKRPHQRIKVFYPEA